MTPGGRLLTVCVVFHVFYFISVFDIYFRSPIEPGIPTISEGLGDADPAAPAKRVVLIVADGLRADTCFRFLGRDARYHDPGQSKGKLSAREAHYQADAVTWASSKTSFLREVIETKGSWGVSHTRVPTESRPGHVAVIAGFYEDVSAVTRGWQDNPVEFDHVFNQSRRTWLWGSPDITRMFAKRHDHVTDTYYSAEEENFAAKDLTTLDTWVFNRVAKMFQEAKQNKTLAAELAQDNVVFFLHLLGLDSNGHAYRPQAPEYHQNMALVDKGVRGIHELFEGYFGDSATSFVFTADHGMNNKGAHGDGDPTNTRTPIIAWGAGVRGPEAHVADADPRNGINTGFSKEEELRETSNWGLDHLARKDVEQADLAPFLATLGGIANPVHSVGRLPTQLLSRSAYTARSVLRNARQLLVQVQFKQEARRARQLFIAPFPPLEGAQVDLDRVTELIAAGEFEEAERISLQVMQTCIEGLRYFQLYDRPYLMSIIVTGYLGWVMRLVVELTTTESDLQRHEWTLPSVLAALCTVGLVLFQIGEQSPILYHVYVCFAGGFWTFVLGLPRLHALWWHHVRQRPSVVARLGLYVCGTQLLMLSYTYRELYVLLFAGLGMWPASEPELWQPAVICYPSHTGQVKRVSGKSLRTAWACTCFLLGACTLMPLDINDSTVMQIGGGAGLFVLLGVLFRKDQDGLTKQRGVQLGLLALALGLTLNTDASLRAKEGLPRLNQLLTWAVFVVAPMVCLWSSATPYKRFLAILASLGAPYVLLSVNYEMLFYVLLGVTLLQWLVLERALYYAASRAGKLEGRASREQSGAATMDDVRTAFVFLLVVHIAFFGTGNIASMASFQLTATYRFVTVFSPFLMAALCITVKVVPYLLVTAHVSMLAAERRSVGVSTVSPSKLFFLIVAMYDMLAVSLFFWVRDEGSWLEIGNSISQFGLVNAQCILLPVLFGLASTLVRGVQMDSPLEAIAKAS